MYSIAGLSCILPGPIHFVSMNLVSHGPKSWLETTGVYSILEERQGSWTSSSFTQNTETMASPHSPGNRPTGKGLDLTEAGSSWQAPHSYRLIPVD